MARTAPAAGRIVVGLDPGSRRTGVALSDELGLMAHARPAILHATENELVDAVVRLVGDRAAGAVVLGLPVRLAGGGSQQTATVRRLARRLRAVLAVPVIEWDERLSSRQAEGSAGSRKARTGGEVDSMAAAVVLQAYLDANRAEVARA